MERRLPRAPLLLAAALAGCSGEGCRSEHLSRHADPGSHLVAYVFKRDCGPSTRIVTSLAVGKRGKNPANAIVVFAADANHGVALQEQGGAIWLRAVWTAPRSLSIAFADGSRVSTKLETANGATIRYRTSAPTELPPVP